MTGTELWTKIVSLSPDLARRTVFCTGSVVRPTTRKFIEETGCPAVSKPFEWSALFAAVAEAASRGAPGPGAPGLRQTT